MADVDIEEDHGRASEQFLIEEIKKRIYCKNCQEYLFESRLEIHCHGKCCVCGFGVRKGSARVFYTTALWELN